MKRVILIFSIIFLLIGCKSETVDPLKAQKNEAISSLKNYNSIDDYLQSDYLLIKDIIDNSIKDINNAKTISEIDYIVDIAITNISLITSKPYYGMIDNTQSLVDYKKDAIDILNNLVDLTKYTTENSNLIKSKITTTITNINNAESKQVVLSLLLSCIEEINDIEIFDLTDIIKTKRELLLNYKDFGLYTASGVVELENIIDQCILNLSTKKTMAEVEALMNATLALLDNVRTEEEIDSDCVGKTTVTQLTDLSPTSLTDEVELDEVTLLSGGDINKTTDVITLDGKTLDTYYQVNDTTDFSSNGIKFSISNPAKIKVVFRVVVDYNVYITVKDENNNLISFGQYTYTDMDDFLVEEISVPATGTFVIGATSNCQIYDVEILEKEIYTVEEKPVLSFNEIDYSRRYRDINTYDRLFWRSNSSNFYILTFKNNNYFVFTQTTTQFVFPQYLYDYAGTLDVGIIAGGSGSTSLNSQVATMSIFIKGKLPAPVVTFTSNHYTGDPTLDIDHYISVQTPMYGYIYELFCNGVSLGVMTSIYKVPKNQNGPLVFYAIAIGDGVNTTNSDKSNEVTLHRVIYYDVNQNVLKTEFYQKNDIIHTFTLAVDELFFLGWTLDNNYTAYYEKSPITSDLTLYASYKQPDIDGLNLEINSNGTYTILGYAGLNSNLIIPSQYQGIDITEIAASAFSNDLIITSIEIPNTVTKIGSRAFNSCRNLVSVVMSDNVKVISEYAFNYCTSLTTFNIPSNLEEIHRYAFANTKLTAFHMPNTVKILQERAFSSSSLTSVTISPNIQVLGVAAFISTSLTSVVIPEGVKELSLDLFSNSKITDLYISSTVNKITFPITSKCPNLTSLQVHPNNTKYITDNNSLYTKNYKELLVVIDTFTTYNVLEGVEIIGDSVFAYSSNLVTINFSNTVKTVGMRAFYQSSLSEANLNPGLKTINSYGFSRSKITSIDIPDSVTFMDAVAFYQCDLLTYVDLPSGITMIYESTFEQCYNLTQVDFHDGITRICYKAFQNTGLQTVDLPNTIEYIDTYTFANTKLQTITLPTSLKSIDHMALGNNYDLTSVIFTSNVTLGNEFLKGTSDVLVTLFENQKVLGYRAFKNSGITTITIPKSVNELQNNVFEACFSLTNVIFEDGINLTRIPMDAFAGCFILEGITLPSTITQIDKGAFAYCYNLRDFTFPAGVTAINSYTFAYCLSLTQITVPTTISSISSFAFAYMDPFFVTQEVPYYDKETGETIIEIVCYFGDYPNPIDYHINPHGIHLVRTVEMTPKFFDYFMTYNGGGLTTINVPFGLTYSEFSFIGNAVTVNVY